MKSPKGFSETEDPKAFRRDVKRNKKAQPSDNRKAVRLIAGLSSQIKKK